MKDIIVLIVIFGNLMEIDMIEDLVVGDEVIFRSDGYLYKGIIKGFQGSKVEIDDESVKQITI